MIDKNVPCYGCERRDAHCHGTCEAYKAFSQKRTDTLSLMRKKRLEEKMIDDVKFDSIQKVTKGKKTQAAWKG